MDVLSSQCVRHMERYTNLGAEALVILCQPRTLHHVHHPLHVLPIELFTYVRDMLGAEKRRPVKRYPYMMNFDPGTTNFGLSMYQ